MTAAVPLNCAAQHRINRRAKHSPLTTLQQYAVKSQRAAWLELMKAEQSKPKNISSLLHRGAISGFIPSNSSPDDGQLSDTDAQWASLFKSSNNNGPCYKIGGGAEGLNREIEKLRTIKTCG